MTNSSHFSQVSDELLSAYLDQAVTAEEKALVEAAITADAEVAWRLETLRQTVTLLKTLPLVALPRSFVLTQAQLVDTTEMELSAVRPPSPQRAVQPRPQPRASAWQTFWQNWRNFWQMGNPMLRNAAAASFTLLLVLLVGNQASQRLGSTPAPMANQAIESAAQANNTQSTSLNAPEQQAAAAPPQPTMTPTAATFFAGSEPAKPAAVPVGDTTALLAKAVSPVTPEQGGQTERAAPVALASENVAAASAQPGEDESVELAPNGPGHDSADETVQASVVGSGAPEQKAAPAAPATQEVTPQMLVTASTAMSLAALSPLPQPAADQVAYTASTATTAIIVITATTTTTLPLDGYTATTSIAAAPLAHRVQQAPAITPTVPADVITPTITTVAPTMTPESVALSPALVQSQPADQNLTPAPHTNGGPWQLAQMTSALLTIVLAGLWWRSRR
jgi:hypothetical protein